MSGHPPAPDDAVARVHLFGHACLGIELAGLRILTDPWILGSCYWRSWWHYPAPPELPEEWRSPDLVYLSHHHFDHFHYPSMRTLDRSATVLIPEFGVDVLRGEVRSLGFSRVEELPHAEVIRWGGLQIASHQHGFDDSALVVSDGDTVVVDLNDCKLRGRALELVREQFGSPTFMLRTHSWAQSYPILYTADDPADLRLVRDESFLDDFADAARTLAPRYAVPFANMVAFLHPQSRAANAHLVTPDRVAARCAAEPALAATEVVGMAPGDSWDRDAGFRLAPTPWWEDREPVIAARAEAVASTLAAQAAEEAEVSLPFATFRAYIEAFAASVPRLARRRFFGRPLAFAAPWDPDRPWWVVDMHEGTVRRAADPPADHASRIWVDEAVLASAIERRVLHVVHGSMRCTAHLAPGGVSDDLGFWGLVAVWEIGYLPLRRLPPARFGRTLARRWREAADTAPAFLRRGGGSPLERLSEGFASSADPPPA